ncbi:recombinase family protein [Streptomyces phaeochromogenes]|uniref:recombinase family protein n=1 Tax=Streptomyces phaeochromogenes TaxID=1923 RepID=UPI0027D8A536|nr:recombinase family protein [Streptomyces phaeochromogenes]
MTLARSRNAPTKRRRRARPQPAEVELLLTELRGLPGTAPSLPEALALRDSGWLLVVAYCRISCDRHRRDGHGIEDQARHCARIAARHRMIIVHRYVDNDKSASKIGVTRPDFDAMLEALKDGATRAGYPIDGVICVSDDRLYRDVRTYQRFLKCFTAHPSRAYADELGTYNLYKEDAARRGLLGAAASRTESKKQQQRAKLNHRARADRGEPVASRRPFGWNSDRITLHPSESEVVRQGVWSFLAGKTLTAVTHDFVASGHLSSLGNPWQRQTVKQILRNPRICGYRKLHGELVRGPDGYPVVGQWNPIVSPEEWQAVADMLDQKRHAGGWDKAGGHLHEHGRYLLTGLVRCGRPSAQGQTCNAPMHGHPSDKSYVYRCRLALDGGCGRVSRQGPAVDDLITQYALDILDRQDTLGARLTAPWPGEHRLELARQQKSLLQEQWYAEEISDALYFSQLTSEEAELKRLVNEQKVWTAGQQSVRHPHVDARTAWNRTSLREKREILSGLLDSVTILPGTKGSHRFEPATVVPVWRDLGSPSLGG